MLHALIHGSSLVLTKPTVLPARMLNPSKLVGSMLLLLRHECHKALSEDAIQHFAPLSGLGSLLASAIKAAFPRENSNDAGGKTFLTVLESFSPPEPDIKPAAGTGLWVRIAIAHAMTITYDLVVNGHPLRQICKGAHVEWLFAAIKAADLSFLDPLPLLKAWL